MNKLFIIFLCILSPKILNASFEEDIAFQLQTISQNNLITEIETKNDLVSLKKLLNDIETQNGRSLGEVKFSSRTLDIDILYYDDIIDEEKNIPRSEIIKFDFVLRPLYDLAPGHIHPNTRKTHNKMLADNIYQKMIIKRISLPLTV